MTDKNKVLVFSNRPSPRLNYALYILLEEALGLSWELCHDPAQIASWEGPCIQYGEWAQPGKGVFIPSCGLLFESGIQHFEVEVFQHEGLPAFFEAPASTGADFPFDLLALAFFIVSRYEEYWSFTPDTHGRFSAIESIAFKNDFLKRPIVQEWALKLGARLQEIQPALPLSKPELKHLLTCDVDLAWAYRYRPWWRALGALLIDGLSGKYLRLWERIKVFIGAKPDPFFKVFELFSSLKPPPHYFFLLGDWGPYDKNISPQHKALQQLIRRLSEQSVVGIHPSYGAYQRGEQQLKKEIQRLRLVIQKEVIHSRQHFLLLRFPDTYRGLIRSGIRHDYSMGYADQTGFRAGLAIPFRWYDIDKEEKTELLIHPFQAMDVTLKDYLKLSPAAAIQQCLAMQQQIAFTGGEFCLLWHNSSFSALHGWESWQEVPFIILDNSKRAF